MTKPNTTNTNAATDDEIAVLRAGLEEAARRGHKLSALKRPGQTHRRAELWLTLDEHASIALMGHSLSLHMGRPISRALTVRLALHRLMVDATRSHSDPALAARLRAEVMDVRGEVAKTPKAAT